MDRKEMPRIDHGQLFLSVVDGGEYLGAAPVSHTGNRATGYKVQGAAIGVSMDAALVYGPLRVCDAVHVDCWDRRGQEQPGDRHGVYPHDLCCRPQQMCVWTPHGDCEPVRMWI